MSRGGISDIFIHPEPSLTVAFLTPGPDREEERDVGVQGPEGGQWPGPSPSKQPIGRDLPASS